MKKIVTFGEIMLRLAPNGYNRFFQDDQLQATFGGGEANVAVSLANYGMRAAFVTRLPSHAIGQGAVNALRALGVRRVIMLTGDQETAARAVCERLGIDTFRAQVLPADKASLIEGYKEGAGWMLPMERTFADQHYQDELDAEMIYNTIEEQIVPKYYDRDRDGVPHAWVESVKKCVADIASNFTTNRMLNDYEERFYNKLAARKHRIVEGGYKLAREIAAWKRKVSSVWDQIRVIDVQRVKIDNKAIFVGEKYHFEVTVDIASLRPEDIGVEMVIAQQIVGGQNANVMHTIGLKHTKTEGSRVTYALDYTPDEAGTFDVALRIFPVNPHLPHRMDFALVKWA